MEKLSSKNILLINPPSAFEAYSGTRVNALIQVFPLLSYLSLGAVLKKKGFRVVILDLGIEENPYQLLDRCLEEVKPNIVGLTSTTPLFFEEANISRRVREKLRREVIMIYGGPHATALPEESLNSSEFDIVVIGEGEETLKEIVEGRDLADIKGIYYKEEGRVLSTPPRSFIQNLDNLPFPALELYDLKRYKVPKVISRGSPVLHIETSRGCPCNCSFCNKNIFARLFRTKSPERVIEEIKYFLRAGAGELRIIDDQFATDLDRAKRICELIIKEKLNFPWNLANGVRVDRVDEEFLRLAKRAGCYQVGIGFESGSQSSLDSIDKGITLEQSVKCAEMVKKAGIETVGFFMLGLPVDTEESLEKTINFALKVMPDFAKTTITIPFPGTRLFADYETRGLIKSRNWSLYNIHKVADVYEHPNLSQETLKKYYNLFYQKFYLHPKVLLRQLKRSIRNRSVFSDLYYGLQTFFPRIFPANPRRRN